MADIELPRDAEGREIPLDTKVLYDRYGFKNFVKSFIYVVSVQLTREGIERWNEHCDDWEGIFNHE